MNVGVLICVGGALSFGLLAVASKLAERRQCNTSALIVWVFGWATLFMLAQSFTKHGKAPMTWSIAWLAIVFGICAAVAYFAFQTSIARGKVTVGWLMMNLSAGVPALVSIWMYGEKLSVMKAIAFGLALVSLLCLFQGNRLEARDSTAGGTR